MEHHGPILHRREGCFCQFCPVVAIVLPSIRPSPSICVLQPDVIIDYGPIVEDYPLKLGYLGLADCLLEPSLELGGNLVEQIEKRDAWSVLGIGVGIEISLGAEVGKESFWVGGDVKIYLFEGPYMDIVEVSLMLPVSRNGIEAAYVDKPSELAFFPLLGVH